MGTWGNGPFGSDTAQDFLEQIEQLSVEERLAILERTFGAALEPQSTGDDEVLPEEVLVAASIVVANLPAGVNLSWNDEVPGISNWLVEQPSRRLRDLAAEALSATFPADGWWWASWVNPTDKDRMKESFDRIDSILRESVGE